MSGAGRQGGGSGEPLLTFLTAGNLPLIEFPFLSPLLEATALWPRCPVQAQDASEVKGHLLVSRVWLWKALSSPQLKASPAPRAGPLASGCGQPRTACVTVAGSLSSGPPLCPPAMKTPLPHLTVRSMRCLWTLAF